MNLVVFYFIQFIIYSFIGWIFECIHMAITTKEVVNRGFLLGPVIPVYGIGLSLIVTFLSKFKNNFIIFLICSILIIGIVEYLVSVILEKLFKIRWWDYSNRKFNLKGRICLNTMTIFVTGATIITYLIHPIIYNIINDLSDNFRIIIFLIFLCLFILDVIFSILITKSYIKNNESKIKDKTPEIRKYTKTLINKKTCNIFSNKK